jgi:hypothetical protein
LTPEQSDNRWLVRSRERIEDAAPLTGRGCYVGDVRAGHGDAVVRRSNRSGILCAAWGPRRKGRERPEIRYPDLERAFDEVARRTAKKFLNDSEDATFIIGIGSGGHSCNRPRHPDEFHGGVEALHAKRPCQFKGS